MLLETPRTDFLELPRGRIAFSRYGQPDGKPILYFHGWPGSRYQARFTDSYARSLGLHVIAPDRPGMGKSRPDPTRTLLDWPMTVAALADKLGLQSFRVVGVSGGGPYALVCAALMPDRVSRVGICSGVPHPGWLDDPTTSGLHMTTGKLVARSPRPIRCTLMSLMKAAVRFTPGSLFVLPLMYLLPQADSAILSDNRTRSGIADSMREAFRGPVGGLVKDLELLTSDWGFSFEEVRAETHIWHGTQDHLCPVAAMELTAAAIPRATLHVIEGEGHYSLPLRHLHTLLETMGR